jgi:proline iminopeptidase
MRPICTLLILVSAATQAADFQDDKVHREGFELYYRHAGAGAPVVILSGGPGFDCDYVLPIAHSLAESHHAILVELRGTGRSRPNRIDASTVNLKQYLGDLEALRDHLKIDRWALLGHSAGALLAMHYASHHADRVDRLVLVASGRIVARNETAQLDNILMRLPAEAAERLKQQDVSPEERMRIMIPGFFWDRAKGAQMAAAFRPESQHRDIRDLMAKELLPPDGDLRPALRGFEQPALVITGRQDPLDPGVQYEIHLALKNSTLELIPRAGHFPWIEQPEHFFAVVREFLE